MNIVLNVIVQLGCKRLAYYSECFNTHWGGNYFLKLQFPHLCISNVTGDHRCIKDVTHTVMGKRWIVDKSSHFPQDATDSKLLFSLCFYNRTIWFFLPLSVNLI